MTSFLFVQCLGIYKPSQADTAEKLHSKKIWRLDQNQETDPAMGRPHLVSKSGSDPMYNFQIKCTDRETNKQPVLQYPHPSHCSLAGNTLV